MKKKKSLLAIKCDCNLPEKSKFSDKALKLADIRLNNQSSSDYNMETKDFGKY